MPSPAERPLERDDLVVRAAPLGLGREALDPLDQHPPVPRAVEHDHAAPAGKHRPESPQEVVALLALARCGELLDPHMPRIQRPGQAADRAALAGGVPALEHARTAADPTAGPEQTRRLQPQRQQSALELFRRASPFAPSNFSERSTSSSPLTHGYSHSCLVAKPDPARRASQTQRSDRGWSFYRHRRVALTTTLGDVGDHPGTGCAAQHRSRVGQRADHGEPTCIRHEPGGSLRLWAH